jgi:hypothetical protein
VEGLSSVRLSPFIGGGEGHVIFDSEKHGMGVLGR